MEFKQKAVIHNRFDVEVRDAKTNELKQTAVAYNIILNRWFHYLTETGGVSYPANHPPQSAQTIFMEKMLVQLVGLPSEWRRSIST